jgi:hypothetical protein
MSWGAELVIVFTCVSACLHEARLIGLALMRSMQSSCLWCADHSLAICFKCVVARWLRCM